MSNNIVKTATLGGIFLIILTPIFIIILGTVFSLLTEYKANDHIIIIRILVWTTNLIIGWIVSTAILKGFFRRKISFISYKYIFFAYIVSVLVIWAVGMDESDYSYVASAITIIGTVGAIWGIKLYKKKKGRPPKK